MRIARYRFGFASIVVSLVAGVARAAHAADGDFAATYAFIATADRGDVVDVAVDLQLANGGTVDVVDGTLGIGDPWFATPGFGSVSAVLVRAGGLASVHLDVSLPRAEFDRWASGGRPILWLRYTHPRDGPVRAAIVISQ